MLAQQKQINQSLIGDGIEPNALTQIPKTYTDGLFDGKIGLEAEYPEIWEYYEGWAIGHREHECKKKGIILPNEF